MKYPKEVRMIVDKETGLIGWDLFKNDILQCSIRCKPVEGNGAEIWEHANELRRKYMEITDFGL